MAPTLSPTVLGLIQKQGGDLKRMMGCLGLERMSSVVKGSSDDLIFHNCRFLKFQGISRTLHVWNSLRQFF